MSAFLLMAALMTAAALMFILPTLLRKPSTARPHARRDEVNLMVLRDQMRELDADLEAGTINTADHASARQELERRVAEDVQPAAAGGDGAAVKRWPTVVLALAVPLGAAGLYFLLGAPAGLNPAALEAQKDAAHEVTPEQMVKMVEGLAVKLKDKPDDAQGWSMLARSYDVLGRYGEAAAAYEHLVKIVPPNADLLADYADTLAMSKNKSMAGEPEKLVQRALELEPKNLKALSLAGSAAFERRDYAQAIVQWKKVMEIAPDSDSARGAKSGIEEAQAFMGVAPAGGAIMPAAAPAPASAAMPAAAAPAGAAGAAASASEVTGTVDIDPALRASAADTDTVFIFARPAQGPRIPLAVLRKQVKDLPLRFALDDSMSVVPSTKLSAYPMVMVGARISKTGNATAAAGDLEGLSAAVSNSAKDLKITINARHN
ncbi:MAG: c-type cytochrome biogenesis protein CcmI [Pseudomonadota bacterium]